MPWRLLGQPFQETACLVKHDGSHGHCLNLQEVAHASQQAFTGFSMIRTFLKTASRAGNFQSEQLSLMQQALQLHADFPDHFRLTSSLLAELIVTCLEELTEPLVTSQLSGDLLTHLRAASEGNVKLYVVKCLLEELPDQQHGRIDRASLILLLHGHTTRQSYAFTNFLGTPWRSTMPGVMEVTTAQADLSNDCS